MNKNVLFVLAMAVGMFFIPAISSAITFDIPGAPVYVSSDVNGLVSFKSEDSSSLDRIQGAFQYCNDIMKKKVMLKGAYRSPVRVNAHLLTIQLYEPTFPVQFSFNVKQGSLWGPIPDCKLIPDGKTVVMEYSGPSRDSEDGQGGHHFSVIAGIKDMSMVNPIPFPDCSNMPQYSAPPRAIQEISPAPTPIVQQVAPAPAYVPTATSVAKSSPSVKRPVGEKECDPCIVAVKADTKAIRKSVGDVDPAEPYEEQTLQSKAKITKEAVGKGKPDKEGKSLSVHDKFGEPASKEDTVFNLLQQAKDFAGEKNARLLENIKGIKHLLYLILLFLIVLSAMHIRRRRSSATTPPPPPPPSAQTP